MVAIFLYLRASAGSLQLVLSLNYYPREEVLARVDQNIDRNRLLYNIHEENYPKRIKLSLKNL